MYDFLEISFLLITKHTRYPIYIWHFSSKCLMVHRHKKVVGMVRMDGIRSQQSQVGILQARLESSNTLSWILA